MTITGMGFDPLGTCVSTFASKMNHSCNPNCIVIFSGLSLSVRSLQPIPAGGELSQSYVDRTMPSSRRKSSLKSVYYFDCTCEYCRSALTCGLPDLPDLLGFGLSSDGVFNLEAEGMRIHSIAGKASPKERIRLLHQAMKSFNSYKDIYPPWRYPWPMIRHEFILAHMSFDNWYNAFGHALKGYFFIEPMLYPIPWDPLRIVRTFLLAKIMIELEYNKSRPKRIMKSTSAGSVKEKLDRYCINWPVAISGLVSEVRDAIPKGFGTNSSFAQEFEELWRGTGLDGSQRKTLWARERMKLEQAAREMVD